MPKSEGQQSVEFATLPKLTAPLAAHPTFQLLYQKLLGIDADNHKAESRKRKLKIITRTAAVHLTCLKLAKSIAVAQENSDEQNKKTWTKALVRIVDRAQDVGSDTSNIDVELWTIF